MNQPLEQQLKEIEQKVIKLVELNAHYRRMCTDLLEMKRKLETENKLLRETMQEQNMFIQELEIQLQAQSQPVAPSADYAALKQQIDTHIAQLDATIQWLSKG